MSAAPTSCCFINGLPLGVIELKKPGRRRGYHLDRLGSSSRPTRLKIPSLFSFNAALIISDGVEGPDRKHSPRDGSGSSPGGQSRTIHTCPSLQEMLEGVCAPGRFLALVRDFIVFEDDGSGVLIKKLAGYHQFHAVPK